MLLYFHIVLHCKTDASLFKQHFTDVAARVGLFIAALYSVSEFSLMVQRVGALLKENRINLNGLENIYGVEKNKKQSSSRQIFFF